MLPRCQEADAPSVVLTPQCGYPTLREVLNCMLNVLQLCLQSRYAVPGSADQVLFGKHMALVRLANSVEVTLLGAMDTICESGIGCRDTMRVISK